MSEVGLNPLESILRMCAASAPEPWYPRLYAKQSDVDREALGQCLDELLLDGLIEKVTGSPETGPGVALTRAGERILLDPEALGRLRAGQPVTPGGRGALVRRALSGPLHPYITILLVLLNAFVFAAGYYFARGANAANDFLRGDQNTAAVRTILDRSGSVSAHGIIEGQWWRLLAAGFVHVGFMHILMNMVFLYLAGRYIEQMWGHFRYLVIYLASILGGSCLAVAHNVSGAAGASGAVCGLLGAEAVWFLFNHRYLPRALMRRAWTGVIINIILLVFISSFQGVSGWGHFGGAAAGALAALLLHLHRFGPPGWRWLALTGFAPLVWYGDRVIEQARQNDPAWHEVENRVFQEKYLDSINETLAESNKAYNRALPVLEKHPTRRDAAEVEKVLPELAEQRAKLQALDDTLAGAGPFYNPDVEELRQKARTTIANRLRLLEDAEHALRAGEKWKTYEQEQHEFETQYAGRTEKVLNKAYALYQQIRSLLQTAAPDRKPAEVEKALDALNEQLSQVTELRDALAALRPYHDEWIEAARQVARSYATACADLLELARRGLSAGESWTDEDKQTLEQQEKKVDGWRKTWKDWVEVG
jgi:rhomboid protease GluP